MFEATPDYFIVSACIFGKENVYYVISQHESVSNETMTEIKQKIGNAGFDPENTAIEGVSPVYFKSLANVPCKGDL